MDWYKKLGEYEADPFGAMLIRLKKTQDEKKKYFLSEEDLNELGVVRERRNYWVHQCFIGAKPIIFKNGEVREPEYAEAIKKDLDMAEVWEKKLADVFCANSKEMDHQSAFDELSKCFDFEIASIEYYPKR